MALQTEEKIETVAGKDQNDETETEVVETEVKEEASADGEEKDEKSDEEDLTPAQLAEAKQIYKNLAKEDTRAATVRYIADLAGIDFAKVETKKEETKAKKDIKTVFKEKLGEKYDFLAPMIGDALEEILEDVRESTNAQVSKLELNSHTTLVNNTLATLRTETKGESKQFEKKMGDLAYKYPLTGDANAESIEEWIRDLYLLANRKAGGKQQMTKKISDQINRNANDVPSRLSGSSSGAGRDAISAPKGDRTLKQSIELAMKQIEKD